MNRHKKNFFPTMQNAWKRSIVGMLCMVLVGLFMMSYSFAQVPWDSSVQGNGTQSDPWQITTAVQLEALADYVNAGNGNATRNKYYILMNDINLSRYADWIPIGKSTNETTFQGKFNGNGKIVQNLTIDGLLCGVSNIGFFGSIFNASIENLGIVNCNVTGCYSTGGLTGFSLNSSIFNCYVTGNVSGNLSNTGGLVGYNSNSFISDCYAAGSVSGSGVVGGLVGHNDYATITNCYAANSVSDGGAYMGGLVGFSEEESTICNCVAANSIVAMSSNSSLTIGRIVGYHYTTTVLYNNYALDSMTVRNSNGNVSITDNLNTKAGIAVSMDTLQSFAFYANASNWKNTVWNIENYPNSVWKICDGKVLPFLRWQGILCDGETGIANVSQNVLQIYPNPTSGQLRIKNEELREDTVVEIYDVVGKLLQSTIVNLQPEMIIDISHLANGIYILKINNEVVKKIIKL